MKPLRRVTHAALTAALTAVCWPAASAPPDAAEAGADAVATCSLEECVDLAVAFSPQLRAKAARVDAAVAQRSSAAGDFLPKLLVDGGVQWWDQALEADLGGGIPGLPAGSVPPFVIRPARTWSVNVTLAQPLTGLWAVYTRHELLDKGVDVERLEREAARRAVALDTTEAWLQVALLRDVTAAARASVTAREGDVKRVELLVEHGVVEKSQLLRAKLGLSDAERRVVDAQRQADLGAIRLATLVGRPVAPPPGAGGGGNASDADDGLPADAPLATALTTARAQRIELRSLLARKEQADTAVDLAWTRLAPDVSVVAAAQFATGSELQSSDAYFIGLNLKWTVWDWGATWYGVEAARAQAREVDAQLTQLGLGVDLEVRAAVNEVAAARRLVPIARQTLEEAEESYALVQARLEEGRATAFDVVDAEEQLTRARIDVGRSITGWRIARARLAHAMGGTPEAIAREGTL
ncbi:MAG: TolC family protein [Deltaproteobacteria bacterium]|nr:TolC family protein [Deltaproteobacteria bacterium]